MLALFAAGLAGADVATVNDWPSYGGTHAALRYSALEQINTSNVKALTPAWIFQTGDYENGLQATPIVIDGIIYLSTSSAWVFALDGSSGRVIWEYHFNLGKALGYGKQNRGVAVGHGRVFLGTADNHMVALDQKTGAELWRVNVEDSRQCGCNITGAPLLVKDTVVSGVISSPLPVLRTFQPQRVRITPGSAWSHASVAQIYSDVDLEILAGYLTWLVHTQPAK